MSVRVGPIKKNNISSPNLVHLAFFFKGLVILQAIIL